MPYEPQKLTIVDPRTLDGDCFEVAEKAVAQIAALVTLTESAVGPARLMARNAELERRLIRGEEVDAPGWDQTAEGRRWAQVEQQLANLQTELMLLHKVAAYNPRNPVRG